MFDFEKAVSAWRKDLFHAGLHHPEVLDELENHLRDDVTKQIQSGTKEQVAFETAVQRIGQTKLIKMEFKKIETRGWNHPLAWFAWGLFVISFFLPSYAAGAGWKCAGLAVESWLDIKSGGWFSIHMSLLSITNLYMAALPFFLSRLSRNTRCLKCLRFANFAAFVLVWSFFLIFFFHSDPDLRIGSYIWTASFLLLFLSSFQRRKQKEQYA
jgi:hypothetical protein